jgi:putative tryptophan/tyrosine transport system substrate-binding protein
MKKKIIVLPLCAMLFALCSSVEAQQQATIPKIGWLGVRPAASDTGRELFGREFRALGYVEGKNIIFEYRSAEDKLERLPALADELVRLKVDVLLASLTPAAVAAKNATRTIPIVFHGGFDPVALGLLIAWRAPAGISRGSPPLRRHWSASDWSYSKKRLPNSPVWQCCGIRRIQALHNNGKKASYRHENWVCNFIPSR